jgi:hypothetical protein
MLIGDWFPNVSLYLRAIYGRIGELMREMYSPDALHSAPDNQYKRRKDKKNGEFFMKRFIVLGSVVLLVLFSMQCTLPDSSSENLQADNDPGVVNDDTDTTTEIDNNYYNAAGIEDPAWDKKLGFNKEDYLARILVDKNNNVYTLIRSDGIAGSHGVLDLQIRKFNSIGIEDPKWDLRLANDGGGEIYSHMDEAGNILLSNNNGSHSTFRKISPQAAVSTLFTFTATSMEGMAVDQTGNFYIAENRFHHTFDGFNYDYPQLIKINSAGAEVWRKDMKFRRNDDCYVVVFAMTTDKAGNVYVAGKAYEFASARTGFYSSWDAFFCKYNPSGDLMWINSYSTGDNAGNPIAQFDCIYDIAIDPDGNIMLAGTRYGAEEIITRQPNNVIMSSPCTNLCGWIAKYTANGEYLIDKTYMLNNGDDCEFRAISIDAVGNVYAAGYIENAASLISGKDGILKKYSTWLVEDTTWNKIYNSNQGTNSTFPITDCNYTVNVDNNGYVYTGGAAYGLFNTNSGCDGWIKKYK